LETGETKERFNQNAPANNFTPFILNLNVVVDLVVHAHAMLRLLLDIGAVQLSQIYQALIELHLRFLQR
jgi:hypothetical protein